ncbi:MAG: signal peptidase I [Myxococcota bacterium]
MAAKTDFKRLSKDAKLYISQARSMRRKHDRSLHSEATEAIDGAIAQVETALEGEDAKELEEALKKLDESVERYMGHLRKSTVREYVEAIGLAVIFALILRTFLIEAFIIPSASMEPTLQEGDRLFVNKLAYGLRIPLTTTRVIDFGLPDRGDVVVFIFPREEAREHTRNLPALKRACVDPGSLREEKDYIKRVIGLPGDKIKMLNNQVYVNGKPIKRTILKRNPSRRAGMNYVEQQREELADGHLFTTQHYGIESNFAVAKPITVKPGHVFVMGDNRDNSSDSRCWGQVPTGNILGKAMIIWFSSDRKGIHWDRLGKLIQ